METASHVPAPAPTPAAVIAVGELGRRVVADARGLFLRGDPRRAAITVFLCLAEGASGPALVPLTDSPPPSIAPGTRREACQAVADRAATVQAELERILRQLRTNERLAKAGLGGTAVLPLDLLVVADLGEPAAGALAPIGCILQRLLAEEPRGMGHLLLSTAVLATGSEGEAVEANVYAALTELDALADPELASAREPLEQALGWKPDPWQLGLYLFDHQKEGRREVADTAELETIMANCLLALLSGGLAQRTLRPTLGPEALERRAYYSSAGSTCVTYAPEPLIERCAAQLGAEFLAMLDPEGGPDPKLADAWAAEAEGCLGDLPAWLEHLATDTHCGVRVDKRGPHLGLSFAFQFEQIPKEEWADSIVSYDALYGRMRLPRQLQVLAENGKALRTEALESQLKIIERLPQTARFYPGGVLTARRALGKLDDLLKDRLEAVTLGGQAAPGDEEMDLQALDTAAWNLPDLPAFIARVAVLCTLVLHFVAGLGAGLAGRWAAARWLGWGAAAAGCALVIAGCALWLWRRDRRLVALRDLCVRNSETKYAAILDSAAREQLIALIDSLREQIATALADLECLKGRLLVARDELTARAQAQEGQGSLWRRSVADAACQAWAYTRWRPELRELRGPLLEHETAPVLSGWRQITTQEIKVRLVDHGRRYYAPLRELTLGEVLRQRSAEDAGQLIVDLANEAIPLLNPSFDVVGGGAYAQRASYALMADPAGTPFPAILAGPLAGWQEVATGDRFSAACCRVRHMIPLAALATLTRRGQAAYEKLDAQQRQALHLFDEWASLAEPGAGGSLHRGKRGKSK